MASDDWRVATLGEVIELKRGYDLPKRDRRPGPYPVVSSSGISGSHVEAKVEAPGVVTGRYGTIGQVFHIVEDFWPLNTALYVRDFKGNDVRFISYLLQTLDFSAYSDKAAVPGVNRNHLHMASVRVPGLMEQQAIACILGVLDDKIDLNRRMNQTLEAMAQAIFKSWFVDFDPVRAKADGEQPPGLAPHIADLFPDAFKESVARAVPEGWSFTALHTIATLKKQSAKPMQSPEKLWEHYSIPAFDASREPAIEEGASIKSNKYRVPPNCVLVSKLNPRFPRVWLPDVRDEEAAICSTEFMPFVPLHDVGRSYLYELMKSDVVQQGIQEPSVLT